MELRIDKIRDELTRTGTSQAQLARRMGVKPQWVHQILNNEISHTLKTITLLAEALDLDPKDLII